MSTIPQPVRAQFTVSIHVQVHTCHGAYTCKHRPWKLRVKHVSNFKDNKGKKPESAKKKKKKKLDTQLKLQELTTEAQRMISIRIQNTFS